MTRIFFLLAWSALLAGEYSLVYVHIGKEIPPYTFVNLEQARLMNDSCNIYLLANQGALQSLDQTIQRDLLHNKISFVPIESIPSSREHTAFLAHNQLSGAFNGFWKYATERFFILFDFLKSTNLERVVHLENDTMLYIDLDEILPQFDALQLELAAPFQSLYCCVPCFVFIRSHTALKPLVDHILAETSVQHNDDMITLASYFRKNGGRALFPLPILMAEYCHKYPKKTSSFLPDNETPLEFLALNANAFPGYLFDAAALGVYVNGNDKRYNPNTGPGQIHHRSLFDPSLLHLQWARDSKGRKYPYLSFCGQTYRIVNLHLHSKELNEYTSYYE